jgi:chitin disaccharide deacetylase
VPRLIVNADDFGLTAGINRGILELHQAGLITSATLMARAGATDQAIEIARVNATLGVGCHIVLVDGDPTISSESVPSLIAPSTNNFFPTLAPFLGRLLTGKIVSEEIEIETAAQIRHLQSRGVQITHVDSHKHIHMFPRVIRPVLRAARACGIRSVRNPFEPPWAVRATTRAGFVRTAQISVLRTFHSTWQRIIQEEGFKTTDGTIAVTGTGILDSTMLRRLLEQVPDGTWELVTHPGYNDPDLDRIRTRLRTSRDFERVALKTLLEFPAIHRVSYQDLDLRS